MKRTGPSAVDLVLLGGGHAHAIVIRQWAMHPVPGVRITLVSPHSLTAYSGMLPGFVAGHYTLEETHIDLNSLCRWAGVRFVQAAASGLDVANRRIHFDHRPSMEYDLLSINTGGAPCLDPHSEPSDIRIPIKPVHRFVERWMKIKALARQTEEPLHIGVVGAGSGGLEILLAMNHALNGAGVRRTKRMSLMPHQLHWLVQHEVLPSYSDRVRSRVLKVCEGQGVHLHRDFEVTQVDAGKLISAHGEEIPLDAAVWCTGAMAPGWVAESELDCDDKGYVQVIDTLQSRSHPEVFAVGDVSVQVNFPRPRAGVFAVRQGTVLTDNLRRLIQGRALRPYRPQSRFLTLLSLGERSAIGHKGFMDFQGQWVWRWKHSIDERFINQFSILPDASKMNPGPMPRTLRRELESANLMEAMRCGGCGAKVSGVVLASVLDELRVPVQQDLPVGLTDRTDVAVMSTRGRLMAQSVDQVRSFVTDPWLFGRIATLHALSDLYAAQSLPFSAMALVTLPLDTEPLMRRELTQLMQGVVRELTRADCALSGGHTAEGQEMTLGLVVNGDSNGITELPAHDFQAGDGLILTKSIGTGVVMAADMRAKASGPVVDETLASMLQSNAQAARLIGRCGVRGMTDVTGFGLAGHLRLLLRHSNMACRLQLEAISVLPGALALLEKGFRSTLHAANVRHVHDAMEAGNSKANVRTALLTDPQTSGGLLAVIPADEIDCCLRQLHEVGYVEATHIGTLLEPDKDRPVISWNP